MVDHRRVDERGFAQAEQREETLGMPGNLFRGALVQLLEVGRETFTLAEDLVAQGLAEAFRIDPIGVACLDEVVFDRLPDVGLTFRRDLAAFRKEGTVTAGTSSGLNDGAAAVLLMEAETAKRLGYRPLARVVASAVAGLDPSYMGLGPIPAIRKVLERAGLKIEDIDLFELNEAFAAQSIPCIRELGIDPAKVNVNGGSIAIGHPLGCSGARITATLLHEMKRRGARYGVVSLCIGVGQGIATIFERP